MKKKDNRRGRSNKYICSIWGTVLLLISGFLFSPTLAAESAAAASPNNTLNIVTANDRPLSVDRLLYMACKEIEYKAVLVCDGIQSGCASANAGEKDGIISFLPNMEETYPNLKRVPVEIEQTNFYAFVRVVSDIKINSWEELEGHSIGILTDRQYILEKIPSGASITTKETNNLVLDGLAKGEYDVAVLTEKAHEKLSPRTDIANAGQLDSLVEYLYIHKNYEYLIPSLADALKTMFINGIAEQILNGLHIPEINQKKTVLHIVSSNTEVAREAEFYATLDESLKNDTSVELYSISLNSRRFSRDPNRLSYIANLLRQDCASRNIAAIIVSGDDALEFLINYYYLYFQNVPVFFYGVSGQYKTIIQGYEDYFTGIVEVLEAYETARVALTLFPDTQNIYVLNDYMTEGLNYKAVIQSQLELLTDSVNINIEYSENLDCASILDQINELPQDSIVFVGSYFTDANGQYYPLSEMKRLLEAKCTVPIFSLHSTKIEYDAVGGKCIDYEKYGEVIFGMLQDLLNGANVADMPVIADSTVYNRWVFDKNKLDIFGTNQRSLPTGAQVINRIPSIWESDPRFAVTLVFLFIASIAAVVVISILFISLHRRKQQLANDAKVRNVKERLERIINTAPVLFLVVVDGIVLDINENMKVSTGLNLGDNAHNIHSNPSVLKAIDERVKQKGSIKNEITELLFVDGVHRCLLSLATVDYDGQEAIVAWAVDIEQSEMQKDQLRNARQTIQTVLDSLPVPVRITDSETTAIMYANNACLEMFGFDSLEEMCSRSIMDVTPVTQSDGSNPREKLERLLRSDEPMNMELEYVTVDGNIIDARGFVCSIDYNGRKSTLGIIIDLAKEREAQRIRQNLQTVLDMLPIAIRIVDSDTTKITYANKAAADMFEIPVAEEAYGMYSHMFVAETQPDGSNYIDMMKNIQPTSEVPIKIEITMLKPNGRQFDALVTACLIDYNGQKSSLAVIQDLTEEKEYQRKLTKIAEKERDANQLKSRFLINMSHEIRTPMNVIIGLTEIELQKALAGESKDIYKKINVSAKNLLAIINDILDLSKIEANKVELYEDEFELEEVLSSALLVASPRLDGKNVEFMLNESLELPRFIVGDRTKLWQILKNFLDNSAKFTDKGKIVLTVFVDGDCSDEETVVIKFVIEDTGIGMDEEQMGRIFMPYEQVYSDAQKKYSGTGLGMVISKHLCELMGGTLQVQSRLGVGTIIHISIPFKRSLNTETEVQSIKSQALSGINVLVVDDDKLSRDIMEGLLKNSGAAYMTASSGTEAMNIILEHRDRGEYFDIILLDYMMNGLNGLETARQINIALLKVPKLLMVTAYQRLLIKSELDEHSICGVIEKPFIPSHFIHKLCVALGLEADIVEEYEVFTRFKNVSVLLCEDYRLNQEVASGMLAQFGVETTIADDGSQGIEILYSGKNFDLIFMDLHMPVTNGFEATRIIRADSRFDNIPIISLTADAMKEAVDECLAAGMNDHIAKPIEFVSLHKILRKWLPESKRVVGDEIFKYVPDPLHEALARFGGSQERYDKALLEFAKLLPDTWQDFSSALKDSENLKNLIHKLKGTAGTLSEKELHVCLTEFETSLHRGNFDEYQYRQVIEVCSAVKRKILEQAEKNPDTVVSLETGTAAEFAEHMNALKTALHQFDPEAIEPVIDSLKSKLWTGIDAKKLKQLCTFAEMYNYTAATEILNEIINA